MTPAPALGADRARGDGRAARRARRLGAALGLVLLGLVMAGFTAWGAGVLTFAGPGGPRVRTALTVLLALVGLGAIVALAVRTWRWRAALVFAAALLAVGGWWSTLQPSNDREWQPEVAVLLQRLCAGSYRPPVSNEVVPSRPPHTTISLPVHMAEWPVRAEGAVLVLVAVHVSATGLYRPPVCKYGRSGTSAQ